MAPSRVSCGVAAEVASLAEGQPDRPAILAPRRTELSFAGLSEQIESVALSLAQAGVAEGDRVAVVMPNGPEAATAFLGVSSCAVCAPLNPAYRAREFDFYMSDIGARALILPEGMESDARAVADRLGMTVLDARVPDGSPAGVFDLASAAGACGGEPGPQSPTGIALVLHTSGTTSRPKIVPLSHGNLCASARNIRETLRLTPEDRCLNVMPLFHIHGLMAALAASLTAGASVICTPGFDQAAFFSWMEEFSPTWYTAVPTMHQAVLAQAGPGPARADRLRFIRSSSAALSPRVMADLEALFRVPVIVAYGMTEASHQMSSTQLPPGTRKPGTVGRGFGVDVAIMDEKGDLLPRGSTGEIVIRGPSVTSGYERNPDANSKAFTAGWFRTGDEGSIDEDGELTITSRIKEIINRGGEKVAPTEIDETLAEHPAVAQAVAFSVPHATLGEDVVAAVVLKPGEAASERDLRVFVSRSLADHKVPSQIVFVQQIPKGPTGKLQRIGLHERLASALVADHVEPRGAVQTSLAEIWREVLRVKRVGALDNFFRLGGDSLKATQVASRIADRLGVDLPLHRVFVNPTISELASVIEEARIDGASAELLAGLLGDIESMTEEQAGRMLDGPAAGGAQGKAPD